MIIKLTEIMKTSRFMNSEGLLSTDDYVLKEVFINPKHVVCLREDKVYKKLLMEDRLMENLDKEQRFTRVYLDRGQAGIEMTVIGSPSSIQEKIGSVTKQLLRG